MRILLSLLVALSASYASAKEISGHHHHGDRHGLHGMVLFGETNYYLSHIPMDRRPHNEQLIMAVTLKNSDGTPITRSFAEQGHSLKPKVSLSLDDLALESSTTFVADVHVGNFEHGGPLLIEDAQVTVKKVLVARNLTEATDAAFDSYLLIESQAWLINRITADRFQQKIERVKVSATQDQPSLPQGVTLKVSRESTNEGPSLFLKKAGSNEGSRYGMTIQGLQWCLEGPDFFQACAAQ